MLLLVESGPGSASTLIGDLARITWAAIALGLAYGLLTMALIQWIKDMFLRRGFNRRQFDRWFGAAGPAGESPPPPRWQGSPLPAAMPTAASQPVWDQPGAPGFEDEPLEPRADLLSLAAAGDADALFGLPIEKMAGQINVAAGAAIESPSPCAAAAGPCRHSTRRRPAPDVRDRP